MKMLVLTLALLSSAFAAKQQSQRREVKRMNVSAYCCCKKCCGKDPNHPAYGITASGHHIKKGDKLVAAPRTYPFNTLMSIPGYADGKEVKVLDRGGAIKGDKLDLYFDTHEAALKWGRQQVDVTITYVEE